MYQRCTRCIMDNASDGTVTFDSNGHCSYCRDIEKRMSKEYFPDGSRKLGLIMEKMKTDCKNDKYDCMAGVSGGLDSSYILYLGHKYGLRMIAVHIDDGLDSPAAAENIKKLVKAAGAEYIVISPDRAEYADVIYSLLKASVSNLAIAQDNLIMKSLQQYGEKNHIKYILDGSNFAHESILERGEDRVNPCDKKYIINVHKRFGRIPIPSLAFTSLPERYIFRNTKRQFRHIRPLNYINYQMEDAVQELKEFCDFKYYGGKHYESVLTRFMQCYYLPAKFGIDKRKSHYSSLIMSGQMSRHEALERLDMPLYPDRYQLLEDKIFLADYLDITVEEMDHLIAQPPKGEREYPHSKLNGIAPLARKFRRIFE